MNISNKAIEECRMRNGNAKPRDDRPDYVNEVLEKQTQVGWGTGLPVVLPDEEFETLLVTDNNLNVYSHYPDEHELLWPNNRDFLVKLFDSDYITSDEDAAKELSVSLKAVSDARDLFNIEVTDGEVEEQSIGEDGMFVLPSGEKFDVEYIRGYGPHDDSRLLTQMMAQDGMSVEEVVWYIEAQGFEVEAREVRRGAYESGLVTSAPKKKPNHAMTLGPNDKVDDHPQTGMFTSKNYDPSRNH